MNITLKNTDYYDNDGGVFVVYRRHFDITDDDITVFDATLSWNCFVLSIKYLKNPDTYKIILGINGY
mgnify:CR=1 FL=1